MGEGMCGGVEGARTLNMQRSRNMGRLRDTTPPSDYISLGMRLVESRTIYTQDTEYSSFILL